MITTNPRTLVWVIILVMLPAIVAPGWSIFGGIFYGFLVIVEVTWRKSAKISNSYSRSAIRALCIALLFSPVLAYGEGGVAPLPSGFALLLILIPLALPAPETGWSGGFVWYALPLTFLIVFVLALGRDKINARID